MKGIENTKKEMSILKNDERMYICLQGNNFQQNNILTSNNDHVVNKNVVNIYIVYKLDPIASTKDTTYLELSKLLKMLLIIQKIIIKDIVYVLMKEVSLAIQ